MEIVKQINIEVAYAHIAQQQIICVQIAEGSNIQTAIECSGILLLFPEIDLSLQKVGIFSKQKKLTDLVLDGDRIEIYRSLTIDPKEARKRRAKKQ